ncbi:MAG: hypothetical protein GX675_06635 [Erysipelotrichaceae bacterium]|nr:hypothetical protein [Erysipelotrichaceae bacterium]
MDWLGIREFIKDSFIYIILCILVILFVVYVVSFGQVIGPSMNNTLSTLTGVNSPIVPLAYALDATEQPNKVVAPSTTANAGYKFNTWSPAFELSNVVSEDTTYVAQFIVDENQKLFDYNINYFIEDTSTVVPGITSPVIGTGILEEEIAIAHPTLTNGYKVVASQPTSMTLTSVAANNVKTVYYEIDTYSITYHLDGGTANNPLTYSATDNITLSNPIKTGYKFVGWSGTGITGTSMEVTIPTGSTGDRVYYAHFALDSSQAVEMSLDYMVAVTQGDASFSGQAFKDLGLKGKSMKIIDGNIYKYSTSSTIRIGLLSTNPNVSYKLTINGVTQAKVTMNQTESHIYEIVIPAGVERLDIDFKGWGNIVIGTFEVIEGSPQSNISPFSSPMMVEEPSIEEEQNLATEEVEEVLELVEETKEETEVDEISEVTNQEEFIKEEEVIEEIVEEEVSE